MRQPGFLSTQHSCWINSRSSHENYKRRARTPTRARMPHVALVPARLGAVARGDAPRRVRAVASARVEASSSKRAPSRGRAKSVSKQLSVIRRRLPPPAVARGRRSTATLSSADENDEAHDVEHAAPTPKKKKSEINITGMGSRYVEGEITWAAIAVQAALAVMALGAVGALVFTAPNKDSPQFQKRDRVENVRLGVVSDVNDAPGAA